MTWLTGLAAAVFAFALVLWRLTFVRHTFETLDAPIKGLLKHGFHGGLLIIRVARSRKFLQLVKYIHGPGDYGLELVFPRAKWSEMYFAPLRTLCDAEQLPYRIPIMGPSDTLEFLCIDFGKDSPRAHAFVRKVLIEILKIPVKRRLYCRLENGTPEDRLIDG